MYILGISAFYHDSAACLLYEDHILAAAQEERFTRIRHDASFPKHAVRYCLAEANIHLADITHIVFYEKPLLKFERLLETYYAHAPRGIVSFVQAMPVWLKEKLFADRLIREGLEEASGETVNLKDFSLLYPEHHLSHAASAFFPSPFQEAAFLTLDGVGEYATTTYGFGEGNQVTMLGQINFPHSLGLLYAAFTYYTGFKINSGEYKLMGLAPYGTPKYAKLIQDHLIYIRDDGSFQLNPEYFNYETGLTMTSRKFAQLFGGKPRQTDIPLTQREMDLAASVQEVTEEVVLKIARHVRRETGQKNLVMAGGVALNCVANGKLLKDNIFENLWIQPAAGDAGGALGAALTAWHIHEGQSRKVNPAQKDRMQTALLGPAYTDTHLQALIKKFDAKATFFAEEQALYETVAGLLHNGQVIGWFQGRMEFGPRALGNRSILASAMDADMREKINRKIKFREAFRPFAPIVPEEDAHEYFDLPTESPYMLLVANVRQKYREGNPLAETKGPSVKTATFALPAITHVDHSARIQTVKEPQNPRLYALLQAYKALTGCAVLVNTSFNVRGEPLVNSPEDAYRCFMHSGLDYLVLHQYLFKKEEQPGWDNPQKWQQQFDPD